MIHSLTLIKAPTVIPQVVRAKRHGIVYPLRAYNAAKKQGLDFALACAILMRETSGGHNVFGHDPTICVGWGTVTKAKYLAYKALRRKTGKAQGVGPCQLTSPGLQDEADAIAGCWDIYSNMLVGFHLLKGYINKYDTEWKACYHYNGSGPAAEAYANAVITSRNTWIRILSGKAVEGFDN